MGQSCISEEEKDGKDLDTLFMSRACGGVGLTKWMEELRRPETNELGHLGIPEKEDNGNGPRNGWDD